MNKYAEVIESVVATFNAELAKLKAITNLIVDSKLEANTIDVLFKDDYTVTYQLKLKNAHHDNVFHVLEKRLLQKSWQNFFTEIGLAKSINPKEYDIVCDLFTLKYEKFNGDIDRSFTVENLTKFLEEKLAVDESKFDEIPKQFLVYTGTYKNRKTEYKSRIVIGRYLDGNWLNDNVSYKLHEFVQMIAKKVNNVDISIKELQDKIGYKHGIGEIEVNLIDGVDFKLKPNGNVDLKLSKDVVEYLNSKL